MLKAKLDGLKPAFVFGLSDGNVQRLKEKKPIVVDMLTLGGPNANVVIMWGPTEEEIAKELNEFILADDVTTDGENAFPRGKLNPDDEGAISMAVKVEKNTLILSFHKPVDWIGLGRSEVEGLIKLLQTKLTELT